MTASVIDGNTIYFLDSNDSPEIDVTDVIQAGHIDVLPGFAFDEKNNKYWIHSKLFKKYARIDKDECRFYVNREWFNSEAFEKQQKSYPEYLLFIKRNCRNHARSKGHGMITRRIIVGNGGKLTLGPIEPAGDDES